MRPTQRHRLKDPEETKGGSLRWVVVLSISPRKGENEVPNPPTHVFRWRTVAVRWIWISFLAGSRFSRPRPVQGRQRAVVAAENPASQWLPSGAAAREGAVAPVRPIAVGSPHPIALLRPRCALVCVCVDRLPPSPLPPPRCVTTRVVKCEIRTFPKPLDGGSTALARFQSDPGSGCSSCHDAKALSQFQGQDSQPRGLRTEAPLNICHSFENQFVKAQVW